MKAQQAGLVGALFFESILVWWWLAAFVIAVVVPRFVSVSSLNAPEDDGGPSFELYMIPTHTVQRDRQNYQSAFN